MRNSILLTVIALLFSSECSSAGEVPPVDGVGVPFEDALLDKMVGHWRLSGTVGGHSAVHTVEAKWILNHQFLLIHEIETADGGTGKPLYEAMPLIGYDHMSDRYVAHWIDVFGGRFSETLGFGVRNGDEVNLVFEYPDGPFHTDFVWDDAYHVWHWHMTQKDGTGKWSEFANFTLSRD
jgi:hypothetical protein